MHFLIFYYDIPDVETTYKVRVLSFIRGKLLLTFNFSALHLYGPVSSEFIWLMYKVERPFWCVKFVLRPWTWGKYQTKAYWSESWPSSSQLNSKELPTGQRNSDPEKCLKSEGYTRNSRHSTFIQKSRQIPAEIHKSIRFWILSDYLLVYFIAVFLPFKTFNVYKEIITEKSTKRGSKCTKLRPEMEYKMAKKSERTKLLQIMEENDLKNGPEKSWKTQNLVSK